MANRKVILIIMDGWGLGKVKAADAIQNANVPFVQSLYSRYPNTTLTTCGEPWACLKDRWEIQRWGI